MPSTPPPDVVVFGNLLLDDVVFSDGRTKMAEAGGAVLYLSLAAAAAGLRVGACSVKGDDYPARALEALATRGVDLAGLRALGGPSLRTWLLYEGRRRRVVHRLEGPTHDDVSPRAADVPASFGGAGAWHLAPMPLARQAELVVAAHARHVPLVSLDPYELVGPGTLDRLKPVLEGIDLLLLSEDEMELPMPADDPLRELRPLAAGRLRWIVLKRGARGGLAWDAQTSTSHAWHPAAGPVVDTTGAGDAFAAGLVRGLLRSETLDTALARGAALAATAVSAWGADGLKA